MGGNALKKIETRRYSKDEYNAYYMKLMEDFKKIFWTGVKSDATIWQIPSYKSKETFGDMDLVFVYRNDDNPYEKIIEYYNLSPDQYVKNGNVFSFAPDDFQIDLINTPQEHLWSSIDYFSYNDLSNLLGRLTHKLGIKLGHRGLSIILRDPNDGSHILKEIILSGEYYDALDILGLDEQPYLEGFDTLEDIFKYVASSKYFSKGAFLLDNRNNTARVRDRKRATYNKFLKWIEATNPPDNHEFAKRDSFGGYGIREPYFSDVVLKKYPHVGHEIVAIIRDSLVRKNFKTYFNGLVVSNQTGLTGRDLGILMSQIEFSDLEKHLISPEMVKDKVSKFFNR